MVNVDQGVVLIFGVIGMVVLLLVVIFYVFVIYWCIVCLYLFMWFVWLVVMVIVVVGQFVVGVRLFVWCMVVIVVMCFLMLIVSLFCGECGWMGFDWLFLCVVLLVILLWKLIDDLMVLICLVMLIEFVGFGLIVCKMICDLWSESFVYFVLCVFKYVLVLLVLSMWSVVVVFYLVVNFIVLIGICMVMLVWCQLLLNVWQVVFVIVMLFFF